MRDAGGVHGLARLGDVVEPLPLMGLVRTPGCRGPRLVGKPAQHALGQKLMCRPKREMQQGQGV